MGTGLFISTHLSYGRYYMLSRGVGLHLTLRIFMTKINRDTVTSGLVLDGTYPALLKV